jgi:hypothetical protein
VDIHDLDDDLRIQATLNPAANEPNASRGLFTELLDRFAEIGGVELDLPARAPAARAPERAG